MKNSLLAIFDEIWPMTLYRVFGQIFEQLQKFIKNPILIGISSNFKVKVQTKSKYSTNQSNS